MLIDDNAQIFKNALDYEIINVDKINCISKDHWNNENDIRSDIEHRIYKKFYNKLIDFEQVLENDIIVFDKYKMSVGFYKDELWFKLSHIMLFEKTFDIN